MRRTSKNAIQLIDFLIENDLARLQLGSDYAMMTECRVVDRQVVMISHDRIEMVSLLVFVGAMPTS